MAVAEGFLLRNPAQLFFTPRECPRPTTKINDYRGGRRKLYGVLDVRERLIAGLAIDAAAACGRGRSLA